MDNYNAETDIPESIRSLNECLNQRQNAYITELGGWANQLDMIFHDFDGWRAKVQEIKQRYPKPAQ